MNNIEEIINSKAYFITTQEGLTTKVVDAEDFNDLAKEISQLNNKDEWEPHKGKNRFDLDIEYFSKELFSLNQTLPSRTPEELKRYFECLADVNKSKDEWISVDDRLPPKNTDVIGYSSYDGLIFDLYRTDDDEWCTRYTRWHGCNIKQWMNHPQPPKTKECE